MHRGIQKKGIARLFGVDGATIRHLLKRPEIAAQVEEWRQYVAPLSAEQKGELIEDGLRAKAGSERMQAERGDNLKALIAKARGATGTEPSPSSEAPTTATPQPPDSAAADPIRTPFVPLPGVRPSRLPGVSRYYEAAMSIQS